ncbi:TetR family transcriptional regulator [Brevibacillus reuszeri]|uniref:TetR family transcriptional regulator n=1 Tax=Brevibacillus reuszeri TaxID=54915 RepID=A0A0K9Z1J9_9BACL|nr:TetR/AcrR family transcriptional regulator [Brevibacillus reuszeri]KNB74806.1 TetR family transcriptional regulator [Brevibacillus reuszeri]MED1859545.1 TetR/AcrR family transcriptional regulator [Brevibacillus reuszeri]GED71955.1 TetR family transcriptional regulator [Brevibacillus reuszeri]
MSKSNETHASLIQVSYCLFAEHGIAKTTYTMIAKEVGIAKPSIYYYFDSKDALIVGVFDELCKGIEFAAFFDLEQFTEDNFVESLIAIGAKMIDEQDKDPYFTRVLQEYMLLATRNQDFSKRLLALQRDYLSGFEALLEKASTLGLLRNKDNLTAKAHMLALILDNIGHFMMFDEQIDYKQIWIEAVYSLFTRDE